MIKKWGYISIWLIGALLYFKSLFFDFTYLDDNVLVLNNLTFLQNLGNFFKAFTQEVFHIFHGSAAYYRPLLTVSFMPEAILGGSSPFWYHLANVIIHLIAASLVFKLFTKLKYSEIISLLFSIIFLVHPALTQAVAWIPGRNDSLLAVFILASFIYFLNFIEEKKLGSMIWSIFFFALALFTKETALVLPALCFFYLWLRGFSMKSCLIKFGAGWLIAVLIWLPLRHIALQNPISMSGLDAIFSVWENVPATIQLLGKVFLPFNLSVLPIMQDTTFIWGFLALVFILVLIAFQKDNYYMMLFGIIWFVLFLWPSFIRPDISGTADFIEHRLYLPIIGLMIFIAESGLGRYFGNLNSGWFLPAWLLVIVIFFGITFTHENNFSDRLIFWQNAASNSPHSSLAQKNLGAMYYLEKNYSLAGEYSQKALTLNSYEPMAHNNLGLIYASRGQFVQAENEYLKEISFNPLYDSAHYNLGLLYYKIGRLEDAKKQWEKTLEINPDYEDARQALNNLGSSN